MRHAAVMFCKDFDFLSVDPDRVRKPDVISHPVQFLHISYRTMSEFL